MNRIVILGAGGFGTAIAIMAAKYCEAQVTLWSPFEEEVAELSATREHKRLLSGITIDPRIAITSELDALGDADLVIIATPSAVVRETAGRIAGKIAPDKPVACVSKGLDDESGQTMSAVISGALPRNPIVILSGPSHAEEVARGVPTTVVAASRSRQAAEYVQDVLMNDTFRIYVNDDVLGVELGGALKNVIAVAAGIADGLEIGGDNTRAALMTRGITEIARLGVALGAKTETFGGLSGIGDLIVTCSSMHSRNRRFGILIGQGVPAREALRQVGMTVEGYFCTKTAWELANRHRIYMPILMEAYAVLYEDKKPVDALRELMARPRRNESETIWLLSR